MAFSLPTIYPTEDVYTIIKCTHTYKFLESGLLGDRLECAGLIFQLLLSLEYCLEKNFYNTRGKRVELKGNKLQKMNSNISFRFKQHTNLINICIKMSVDKVSVKKLSVDKMSVDKMSVDKMSVDKMSVDKMSVDKMSVDKMSFWHK